MSKEHDEFLNGPAMRKYVALQVHFLFKSTFLDFVTNQAKYEKDMAAWVTKYEELLREEVPSEVV